MANYIQPYAFNIVLNSLRAVPPGVATNDSYYNFNWTNIPPGKYEMEFSCLCQNNGDYVANDVPQLFLTLGTVPSVYECSVDNPSGLISTFIGNLRAQTHAAGQVNFVSSIHDNPPVFFNNLPSSGPIRLQVFEQDFTTPFLTQTGGLELAEYVIVLRFRKVAD